MENSILFINRCFDKKRLRNFILWFFQKYGENETIQLLENLKKNGFKYATKAGVSIGIDDLKIPFIKVELISSTEQNIESIETFYKKGNLTEIERQQQIVNEWSTLSDKLKYFVIQFFKATDIFNPIYMMAFSGARGNISQVRQLIGMRGLMSDPQGQILDFPIRSNFREGLTLTEYLISCYGARKGVVDTALRTATSGYLTRRLVDVTQQVVIGQHNCHTARGIQFKSLSEGRKTILSLKDRLIGRVLMENIFDNEYQIGLLNQEISSQLAIKISRLKNSVFIRSPLTCKSKNSICQLCYGWSLSCGAIVSIGEAVGVLAAQSIGEPGTQLTMRTFHTGGIFTGSVIDRIYIPFEGKIDYLNFFHGTLIRTLYGKIGFLTKTKGSLQVKKKSFEFKTGNIQKIKRNDLEKLQFSQQFSNLIQTKNIHPLISKSIKIIELALEKGKTLAPPSLTFNIPIYTTLFTRQGELVNEKSLIAELSSSSVIKNQQQEVEQEVFSSSAGQVFFENLILIEKSQRTGSFQNITYGLGSIWVAAANLWNPIVNGFFFPRHGDFMNIFATVQKFQIVPEKNYYLDLHLSNLILKIKLIKDKLFSINTKKINYESESLENLFFKKSISYILFKNIYFQNYRYFILFKLGHWFSLLNVKRSCAWTSKNSALIGLNFGIIDNVDGAKPCLPNSKNLFGSLYHFKAIKNRKHFIEIQETNIFPSQFQKPVISRKKFTCSNNKVIYYFWPNTFKKTLKIKKLFNYWDFYCKNRKIYHKKDITILDIEFLKFSENNINKDLVINKFNAVNTVEKVIKKNLIPKKFVLFSPEHKFIINLNNKQNYRLYKIWKKTAPLQLFYSSINRQGVFKLEQFKSVQLNKKLCFSFFRKKNNSPFKEKITKHLFAQYPLFNKKHTNQILLLVNSKITADLYSQSQSLITNLSYKIINYFDQQTVFDSKINTYSSLALKIENLKIGVNTKFKVQILPKIYSSGKKQNYNINRNVESLIKLKKMFSISKDLYFDSIHRQIFLNWICTGGRTAHINCNKLNCTFSFGSFFYNNLCFDNQKIIFDIVYKKPEKLFKYVILHGANFKSLKNRKRRFLVPTGYSPIFEMYQKILFPKREEVYLKNLFFVSKILNVDLFNLLIFNKLNIYSKTFQKKAIEPTKTLIQLSSDLLNPNSNYNFFIKDIYYKNKQLKVDFDQSCHIFFRFYSHIKTSLKGFSNQNFKNINSTLFLPILAIDSDKKLKISLTKKFKLPQIQQDIKYPVFKLFSYCSRFINFKHFLLIKFFIDSKNGEVILTKYQNKIEAPLILTRSHIKGFEFNNLNLLEPLQVGNFIRYGDKIEEQKVVNQSGQIIYVDKQRIMLRLANPFLVTSKSLLNVSQKSIVKAESRLFTFLYNQIKIGDIIQGIPRIEEFFEARSTREGVPLITNLHIQLINFFKTNTLKLPIIEATQKSFEAIQQIIIDEVQTIYCSQGIYIADKHLEIVIRQMTSKVQIIDGGKTGLLAGELIEFDWIQLIHNRSINYKIKYKPIVLGITKSCLETESFISAASFQETTRILAKAAIQNKIDFIRGLKQNVILGNLVPAGTGFFSPIYFKYLRSD